MNHKDVIQMLNKIKESKDRKFITIEDVLKEYKSFVDDIFKCKQQQRNRSSVVESRC